jgi:hypothetical protein
MMRMSEIGETVACRESVSKQRLKSVEQVQGLFKTRVKDENKGSPRLISFIFGPYFEAKF